MRTESQKAKEREERARLARERREQADMKRHEELQEMLARRQEIRRKQEEERRQRMEEMKRRGVEHRSMVEERRRRLRDEENVRELCRIFWSRSSVSRVAFIECDKRPNTDRQTNSMFKSCIKIVQRHIIILEVQARCTWIYTDS